MNCLNCKHLITQVIENDSKGNPYKYMCRKNAFPSIPSHSTHGKSLNYNGHEYYTDLQLENYKKKRKVCHVKLGLNTSNSIALAAIIISIIAFFKEPTTKNQTTTLNKKEVIFLIDSIIYEKSAQEIDTLPKHNKDSIIKFTRHNKGL